MDSHRVTQAQKERIKAHFNSEKVKIREMLVYVSDPDYPQDVENPKWKYVGEVLSEDMQRIMGDP
jgi:hypothetical protein